MPAITDFCRIFRFQIHFRFGSAVTNSSESPLSTAQPLERFPRLPTNPIAQTPRISEANPDFLTTYRTRIRINSLSFAIHSPFFSGFVRGARLPARPTSQTARISEANRIFLTTISPGRTGASSFPLIRLNSRHLRLPGIFPNSPLNPFTKTKSHAIHN